MPMKSIPAARGWFFAISRHAVDTLNRSIADVGHASMRKRARRTMLPMARLRIGKRAGNEMPVIMPYDGTRSASRSLQIQAL